MLQLYMGNDVFFFNDKTGRVERLHPQLERGDNYAGLMDSVLTRSAQCVGLCIIIMLIRMICMPTNEQWLQRVGWPKSVQLFAYK